MIKIMIVIHFNSGDVIRDEWLCQEGKKKKMVIKEANWEDFQNFLIKITTTTAAEGQ